MSAWVVRPHHHGTSIHALQTAVILWTYNWIFSGSGSVNLGIGFQSSSASTVLQQRMLSFGTGVAVAAGSLPSLETMCEGITLRVVNAFCSSRV